MISIKIKSKFPFQKEHTITGLTDVEQDDEAQFLSESENGLCSYGHASCYAIIIDNGDDIAVIHASSLPDDLIDEVMDDLTSQAPENRIKVTLARYFPGYAEDYENEKIHCETNKQPFERLDIISYFAEQDAEYNDYFYTNFRINPTFIEMSHDFLVVQKNKQINLFENFSPENFTLEINNDGIENTSSPNLP